MCVATLVAHMKCVQGKQFLALTILAETLGNQSVQCTVCKDKQYKEEKQTDKGV